MAVLIPSSKPWISRFGRCSVAVLLFLLVCPAGGQAPNVGYRIKAAYIFNFAKFVSWPSPVFAAPDSPIVIGILGKDPFGSEIDETIAGKRIEKRPLQARRLSATDPLENCHILFIASSERRAFPQILERLARSPVLTVSETEDFTETGGMIRFFQHENHIRFEVDLDPVETAGLKISSKLLQIATVKGKARK